MRGLQVILFSVLPFLVAFLWLSVVIVLGLYGLFQTGGHPPFIIIPMGLAAIGICFVFPPCLILALIGLYMFWHSEIIKFGRENQRSIAPLFWCKVTLWMIGPIELLILPPLLLHIISIRS